MKKRHMVAAGLLSLSMLIGSPVANVLAADDVPVVASHSDLITRGDFFTMLVNAIDLPNTSAEYTYKDLKKNSPYYGVTEKLLGNHVIAGFKDNTIRLNQPVKQTEALAFIGRALGMPNTAAPGGQSQLPATHWAYNLSTWFDAAHVNIDWTKPDKLLTKQDAETLINQLLTTSDDTKKALEDNYTKQQDVKSATMKLDLSAKVEGNPQGMAGHENDWKQIEQIVNQLAVHGDAAYILPDKMKLNIAVSLPAIPNMPPMPNPIQVEEYMMGKDLYVKVPAMPGAQNAPQWMKMENVMPDMKSMMQQHGQVLPEQLAKKLFYRNLGNGQFAFQGRIDHLSDLMDMFGGNFQGVAEMKKALSQADAAIDGMYLQGTFSVDPKTNLSKDGDAQIVLTFKDKIQGENNPLKRIILHEKVQMADYNTDIKIDLPAEAKDAKSIPGMPGMMGVPAGNPAPSTK
ncbi:S-layer homology domain-containing protein [Aneurinibacillus terranovensis]|uniref:S-layer homology domain-containing protein n=1 Tax=Aneurinibacillus terranovensis TaxID=278991 RepID=UPI00041A4901|nr:S-layer homology domain-containing protein [Aneurinibacillus terranovensis]